MAADIIISLIIRSTAIREDEKRKATHFHLEEGPEGKRIWGGKGIK